MQRLRDIQTMLAERGLSPNKRFGQNFLIDKNLLARLISASGVSAGDVVLEVGPGTGTLTESLLEIGATVVACEIDRGLAELLRDRFADAGEQFSLLHDDCLAGKHAINPDLAAALAGRPFRLVANLPYAAATPLMLTLLVHHPECSSMTVTIQREVADRLLATPGSHAYGEISVLTAVLASARRVADLSPECFWPRPKVHSTMLHIERRADADAVDAERLAEVCQRLFGRRRKQIGSILGRDLAWPEGVSATDRVEQLAPEKIVSLAEVAAEHTR